MLDRKISGLIDGRDLLRLAGETAVSEAARQMSARHVGTILVCEADKVRGIFTERDLLRSVVEESAENRQVLDDLWEGFPV